MADYAKATCGQKSVRWVQEKGSRARVCDRCTEKKIKCDMNQPICSACARSKQNCTFSRLRKRPGPPRRPQRQPNNVAESECFNEWPSTAGDTSSIAPISHPFPDGIFSSTLPDPPVQVTPPESGGSMESLNFHYSLFHSRSRSELAQFFTSTVNVCYPLFQRDTLLKSLEVDSIHPLPFVVYGISARLIGKPNMEAEADVDSELRRLVHTQQIKADNIIDPKALHEWQAACLLTWYGFHQRLGTEDEMHMAITTLTRKAYHLGLHQIDSPRNRGCYGWDLLEEPRLEDWRRVWWCIYALDSYSSFSTGTPTQVETESIQTALPLDPSVARSRFSQSAKIFLPAELEGLPAVTQDIGRGLVDKGFGFYMAVKTLLKAAVSIHRLSKQSSGDYISGRISALRDHLAALQLTLPPYYMQPTPDAIGGKLLPGFNPRLQTQLKLHSIRLLLNFSELRMDTKPWLSQWQENLDICYRMFEVIQHWDSQSSLTVDPAICFIASSLLIMLHLHSVSSANSNAVLLAQLKRRKEVVRLFLENYASYWRLPRFLLDCCITFTNKISGSLSAEDILQISEHIQGPLHQKWLSFLSPGPGSTECLDFDDLMHLDWDASIENLLWLQGCDSVPNLTNNT